jgi:eukaryotic-like serine/threonine-protein kinase
MRKGEVIKGYRVLVEPTNASGGQCRWSFAERDGRQFFIKEFLTPKFPTPDSPGSAATKEKKRAACQRFEEHHRQLMQALSDLTARGGGGNLITAIDLFLWNTTYFKITEKVDVASVGLRAISRRSLRERLLLLLTVSHSVEMLHRKGIVHGDLKPTNILVKVTPKRELTAKLIDFDNAFVAGKPPEDREEVVGDFAYYSPELYRYVVGRGRAAELGIASDVFALGLIFSQYLTGKLPGIGAAYSYACVAGDEGQRLHLDSARLPTRLSDLLKSMLEPDPTARPTVAEIFRTVKELRTKEPTTADTPFVPAHADDGTSELGAPEPTVPKSRLRGLEKFSKAAPEDEPAPADDRARTDGPSTAGVLRGLEKFKKSDA